MIRGLVLYVSVCTALWTHELAVFKCAIERKQTRNLTLFIIVVSCRVVSCPVLSCRVVSCRDVIFLLCSSRGRTLLVYSLWEQIILP